MSILVNGLFSRTRMKIGSARSLITSCLTSSNASICIQRSNLARSPGDGAPPPLALSPAHTRGALLASWQEKGGALVSSYLLLPSSPTNDRTINHLGLSFYLTEPYLQSIGLAVANVTESFCLMVH
jgi:hypothetical protein